MNYRMVYRVLCLILRCIAVLMLIPALIGTFCGEKEAWAFYAVIAAMLAFSCTTKLLKPRGTEIYAREGFAVVALSWVVLSAFGALPFCISGVIPNYINALFETISGFTTTGATILTDIEALPKCMLFWRSFSHWIGGMGVLMFVLALIPLSSGRDMHIMRAEVPGPTVGKLVPKIRSTAKILYGLYIALSVIETIFLLIGGMSLFDAVTHMFATAGTGGFSTKNAGIAYFDSAYIDVVLTVFMLVFSLNFNLIYLMVLRKFHQVAKDEEMRWFLIIVGASMLAIAVNISSDYDSFSSALRYASFQTASIVSTTGFVTADYTAWPQLSQTILVLLMCCGACAGSTGGGIKFARLLISIKSVIRELRRMLHPRSVKVLKMNGEALDESTVTGANMFLLTYVCLIAISALLVSINGFDFETTLTAVLTTINNVGPGMGQVIGPTGNFASLSYLTKLVLSFDMLLGRLEIFPMLMLLSPELWRRRRQK